MTTSHPTKIVACCLSLLAASLLAGCVSDELVVFKEQELGKKEAKKFAGTYQVRKWPNGQTPDTVRVTHGEMGLRFAYSVDGKKTEANFLLSRIPHSEKNLLLISIPKQEGNQVNIFLVARKEGKRTDLWQVLSDRPVAQGRLEFNQGKAHAPDVKKFLSQHADKYVEANEPFIQLEAGAK